MKRRDFISIASIGTFASFFLHQMKAKAAQNWTAIFNVQNISSGDQVTAPINELVGKYSQLFQTSATSLGPHFESQGYNFGTIEQHRNTGRLNTIFTSMQRDFDNDNPMAIQDLTQVKIPEIESIFRLPKGFMGDDRTKGMLGEFRAYIARAEELNVKHELGLGPADIFQAGRNVLMAVCLQQLFGHPVEANDAIVGYSLLYPITDNYIDDQTVSSVDKHSFARRFEEVLKGERLAPRTIQENRAFKMVEMIQRQFPFSDYPQVSASLVAIHQAQMVSVQTNSGQPLSESEMIQRTVLKGGTSVLADAYLINGRPTKEMAELAFALGVTLQLVDDLQDVEKDRHKGANTLFTRLVHNVNIQPRIGRQGEDWEEIDVLDRTTTQTLNFALKVIDNVQEYCECHKTTPQEFQEAIQSGIYYLVAEAVYSSRKFHSGYFSTQVAEKAPVAFSLGIGTVEEGFTREYGRNPHKVLRLMDNVLQA